MPRKPSVALLLLVLLLLTASGSIRTQQMSVYTLASDLQVERLPESVNSPYHDFSPTISADHKILIFGSDRPGGRGETDLYESSWVGGAWSHPRNISEVNTESIDETPFLTPDGSMLLFSSNRLGSTRESSDLYYSLRDGSGKWSTPLPFGSAINSVYSEKTPVLSPDGQVLLFTRFPKGKLRESQILSSVRPLGTGIDSFRSVASLPYPINNHTMDACPVFHPQAAGIFFSSYRNIRQWDIYWVPILANGSFGEVTPLPEPVNSGAFEAFFSISGDGRYIYFSRLIEKVGTREHFDIFRVSFPRVMQALQPAKHTVRIVILDQESSKRVTADLYLWDPAYSEPRFFASHTELTLRLRPNQVLQVTARSPGYLPKTVEIDGSRAEITLRLAPIRSGATAVLPKILFETGTADVTPNSLAALQLLYEFLKQNPDMVVELSGHTDNRGDAVVNLRLSLARAEAVRRWLGKRGIDTRRMQVRGYGDQQPRADNQNERGRQQNRRTELKILKP